MTSIRYFHQDENSYFVIRSFFSCISKYFCSFNIQGTEYLFLYRFSVDYFCCRGFKNVKFYVIKYTINF